MKKFILIFSLLVVFLRCPYAQRELGLGFRTGLNNSIITHQIEGDRSSPGFYGGVYANVFPVSFMGLQLEMCLSQKGKRWDEGEFKGKTVLVYVDLPILLRIQPAPMLSLHFGPQFGYLLSAREKILLTDNKTTTNVKNWYEDYDLGFLLGMEFNLPLRTFLTIRYVYGLSTVTSYYGADEKNNLIQISAGYRFKGK